MLRRISSRWRVVARVRVGCGGRVRWQAAAAGARTVGRVDGLWPVRLPSLWMAWLLRPRRRTLWPRMMWVWSACVRRAVTWQGRALVLVRSSPVCHRATGLVGTLMWMRSACGWCAAPGLVRTCRAVVRLCARWHSGPDGWSAGAGPAHGWRRTGPCAVLRVRDGRTSGPAGGGLSRIARRRSDSRCRRCALAVRMGSRGGGAGATWLPGHVRGEGPACLPLWRASRGRWSSTPLVRAGGERSTRKAGRTLARWRSTRGRSRPSMLPGGALRR